MIKVNLQNIAVNNMLTGQNTLDSIFIDGNSIYSSQSRSIWSSFTEMRLEQDQSRWIWRLQGKKSTREHKMTDTIIWMIWRRWRSSEPRQMNWGSRRESTEGCSVSVRMWRWYLFIPAWKLDVTTGESVEVKQAEYTDYVEIRRDKADGLDILALDVDRTWENDCQWLQKKGCGISLTTTPGVPLEIEGGTLEEAIAALIEEKAA